MGTRRPAVGNYMASASYPSPLPPPCSTGQPFALAAASWRDSASTMEYPPAPDAPRSVTLDELTVTDVPNGLPASVTDAPRVANQAPHACIDCSCSSGVVAGCAPVKTYTNFAIAVLLKSLATGASLTGCRIQHQYDERAGRKSTGPGAIPSLDRLDPRAGMAVRKRRTLQACRAACGGLIALDAEGVPDGLGLEETGQPIGAGVA